MSTWQSVDAQRRRLGRAVLFVLQQEQVIPNNVVRADIDTLIRAAQAMDFAVRLQGYQKSASPGLAKQYSRQAGISERDLYDRVLPALKKADLIDYSFNAVEGLTYIEEYVGITGKVIDQAFFLLSVLQPTAAEIAVLHSIDIAAWAPLTESQHLEQISRRGVSDTAAADGLRLALAIEVNRQVLSNELNETIVFNPHVWGTGQIKVAEFLKNLPPNERDALLGICEEAANRPGLALSQLPGLPRVIASARKVGLVQAATVRSSGAGGRSQTYVFSPLVQPEDDQRNTTEALHLRKLFIAHILFGQEQAQMGLGTIQDPLRLVSSLLNRGIVGPATNIGTDYHLVEAAGIVQVVEKSDGRAFLRVLKREIVEGGLDWLRASLGNVPASSPPSLGLRQIPGEFVTPERDRAGLHDDAAANEIVKGAILRLREEAQRAARFDSPF